MTKYYPMIGQVYTTRYGGNPHMPLFISYKDFKIYNTYDVCMNMGRLVAAMGTYQMRDIIW